jgi:sugar phosphate isomerase/epimerase
MEADLDGTLEAIAEIGYRDIEFAGLHGLTAREVKGRLDALGLSAVSSHQEVSTLGDGWRQAVDDAAELGQSLIVVPYINSGDRSWDDLARFADAFNAAGEVARASGLRFGYHNHDWEHRRRDGGETPMEFLLRSTDPELVDWQMDVYWTVQGHDDARAPFWQLEKYGDRVTSLHVKDRTGGGDMVDVGAGVIDYGRFIRLAQRSGRVGHVFVEHDEPENAIESVRASFNHLRRVLGTA